MEHDYLFPVHYLLSVYSGIRAVTWCLMKPQLLLCWQQFCPSEWTILSKRSCLRISCVSLTAASKYNWLHRQKGYAINKCRTDLFQTIFSITRKSLSLMCLFPILADDKQSLLFFRHIELQSWCFWYECLLTVEIKMETFPRGLVDERVTITITAQLAM